MRLEKNSFPEFSKLEDTPEESGFVLPAIVDVINANWSVTAASTDTAVLSPALAGVSLVGGFCICMAACTALVTTAVIEAVSASILTLVLGGPGVADDVGNRLVMLRTTTCGAASRAVMRGHSFAEGVIYIQIRM